MVDESLPKAGCHTVHKTDPGAASLERSGGMSFEWKWWEGKVSKPKECGYLLDNHFPACRGEKLYLVYTLLTCHG